MDAEYIASCPAGLRCPFRCQLSALAQENTRLRATVSALTETESYLNAKCASLLDENTLLRIDLQKAQSEAEKNLMSPIKLNMVADDSSPHARLRELEADMSLLKDERASLLLQVELLQSSLEKLANQNELLMGRPECSQTVRNNQHEAGPGPPANDVSTKHIEKSAAHSTPWGRFITPGPSERLGTASNQPHSPFSPHQYPVGNAIKNLVYNS